MPAPAAVAAAPPLATLPAAVTPPTAPALAPVVVSPLLPKMPAAEMSPMTAQALGDYQRAMAGGNYAGALRALELARDAGELPLFGLNEMQSAEELARMAILSNDGNLTQVYLRQASALGSALAQEALNRLAVVPDLRAVAGFASREATPGSLQAAPVPPPAAPAPEQAEGSLFNRLFGGSR